MREGLQIKEGEQPMKMVKSRAATINKRRAHELAIQEGREEDTMQGLYARWQTSQVVPDPVVDVSADVRYPALAEANCAGQSPEKWLW